MTRALQLVSKIVASIRHSVVDTKTLLDSVGFKIPMMNATRWNSQYEMIKKFLEAIERDSHLQNKLNACKAHGFLSAIQLKSLKEFTVLLGPFKMATDAFQKDHETVGLAIPIYLDMLNKCTLDPKVNPDAALFSSCSSVAKSLRESLETRMSYLLKDSIYILGNVV